MFLSKLLDDWQFKAMSIFVSVVCGIVALYCTILRAITVIFSLPSQI